MTSDKEVEKKLLKAVKEIIKTKNGFVLAVIPKESKEGKTPTDTIAIIRNMSKNGILQIISQYSVHLLQKNDQTLSHNSST